MGQDPKSNETFNIKSGQERPEDLTIQKLMGSPVSTEQFMIYITPVNLPGYDINSEKGRSDLKSEIVEGRLDSEISVGIGNDYGPMFDSNKFQQIDTILQSVGKEAGTAASGAAAKALKAIGLEGSSKYYEGLSEEFKKMGPLSAQTTLGSSQTWRGSKGTGFNFTISFVAWDDPDTDVRLKVNKLYNWALPELPALSTREDPGVLGYLLSPPILVNIDVPNVISLTNMLIVNVDFKQSTRLVKSSNNSTPRPIAASGSIAVIPKYVLVRTDMDRIFR